jgi:hypothetical protein
MATSTTAASAIADSLASSAAGPKTIAVQGMGQSSEHPIPDQIAAVKFLTPLTTRQRVGGGIKFTKATAGGAVS